MDNIVIVRAITEHRKIEKKTHVYSLQIQSSVMTSYGSKTA